MNINFHSMSEHPEVGKKVVVGFIHRKDYIIDKTFAVWDGRDWQFDTRPKGPYGLPILYDQLAWREVLPGKMSVSPYDVDEILEPCKHLWGYGASADGGWLYYEQRAMREDAGLHLCNIFRYCPICGKKLVLSESENEVDLIEEVI